MDETELQQQFDAIYMAILHGRVNAARSAFEASIEMEVEKKLDQTVKILKTNGIDSLIKEIEKLKP